MTPELENLNMGIVLLDVWQFARYLISCSFLHIHVLHALSSMCVSSVSLSLSLSLTSNLSYQNRIHHYRIIPGEEGKLSIQVSIVMHNPITLSVAICIFTLCLM